MRKILILLLMVGAACFAQTPPFRHYTVNDGLASSMVYYAMQDSKGFIWFCTESGVNRFDGRTFEVFTVKDGLANNENFRCMEDSKGRIWFASYNGKLSYFKEDTFINEKTDKSLGYLQEGRQHIVEMIEDRSGNIWFSRFMDKTNYKYDGWQVHKIEERLKKANPSNTLLFNDKGTVNYFKFSAGSLYRENLDKNIARPVRTAVGKYEDIGNACSQRISDDLFYFITTEGLRRYSGDSCSLDLSYRDIGLKPPMVCFKLIHTDLWIGGFDGLFMIPDFRTKGFTGKISKYLDGFTISSIISDNEGGIWITTLSDGVYYIPVAGRYTMNIPGESVTCVKQNPAGTMLAIGTYHGKLSILPVEATVGKTEWNISMPPRIKGLKWLSDHEILIGTDLAPYVFDLNKNKKTYLAREYNGKVGFRDMDEGSAGIWMAGSEEIFLLSKENRIPTMLFRQSDRLSSVAEDGNKGCWFTTVRDLYRLDLQSKKVSRLFGQEMFHSNLKDLRHVNGYLWVATDGNGLFIFKDNRLVKRIHSGNSSITSDVCQKIEYDGRKSVWVATNRGISVFDISTMKLLMSCTSHDILINNGITDLDLYNRKAYVATSVGISIIDMDKLIARAPAPKLYIRQLVAGGKTYDGKSTPEFVHYSGVIRLAYTAVTFQSNPLLLYRYKMEPGDGQWHETKSDQQEFYNLNPGTYTVLLCAKKYNSDWSPPLSFSFIILPKWYQSGWFILVCILLLLSGSFLLAYRLIKANKRKYEIKRKMAESELRIIRLHMNPHFIFNTLNSLQLFIFRNRFAEANNYISKFSQLIRWIMSYSDKQEISLQEDLDFLETYIELEQLRFEKTFEFMLQVDKTLNPEEIRIPPLIMQPFVENAIKYGLSGRTEKGRLLLKLTRTEGFILVTIEDNGVGRDQVKKEQMQSYKKTESTGITYTEERLKLLIKNTRLTPLKITDLFDPSGKATGTRIELIIPANYE